MRLPPVPRIRIGWRLLSFLLAAGLSALIYFSWTAPQFTVTAAEVQGATRFSSESINNALLVHNKPIFVVQPKALERQLLMTFPGLLDVSVQVGFPARVVVIIEERLPVIAWQVEDDIQWVDADGIHFPPRGEAESLVQVQASTYPPVPLQLEEEIPAQDMDTSPREFMSKELVDVVLYMGEFTPGGSPLVYDLEHGFGWYDPAGWDVFFGLDVADINMKLTVYETVVRRLQGDGLQPTLISMEHLHAPYYRLEQ
jgi:cell division protein FtsQ